MIDIVKKSQTIKEEAIALIQKFDLLSTLRHYGEVKFTGSFELDLMLKKDIDISLVNDDLTVEEFTELGKELIDKLNTPSVYYRNTRITSVEKRPENSLYWGIQVEDWFLDIWAMSSKVYERADKYIKLVKSKLNDENRLIILSLKNDLMEINIYGKGFGSREIYDAVLNYDISTAEQFDLYLSEYRNKNTYF